MADAPEIAPPAIKNSNRQPSLRELAVLFLKLGVTAFGGPAAHIAMMEDEVVHRRGWLTREAFLDFIGATNLIPGPNSTEMAIHIGYLRAGWAGLLVAGSCFILPATIIVTAIAWAYVRYGTLPQTDSLLYGVKPVIIAIVLQALWRFARTALKTWVLVAIALACVALSFLGAHELLLLLGAGAIAGIGRWFSIKRAQGAAPFTLFLCSPIAGFMQLISVSGAITSFSLWSLFLFFLKVGSVLFGSGGCGANQVREVGTRYIVANPMLPKLPAKAHRLSLPPVSTSMCRTVPS